MVFSSLFFLFVFFPIAMVLYFIVPKKLRNLVLFITSLIFYAWGEPIYILLMIFSTVVDYTHGILVSRFKEQGKDKKAKMVVASSMLINLSLLAFFKYAYFLIASINELFSIAIPLLALPLPIGISFYTFQTMSYTIDVYRGDAKAQKNIISFGAYVALFPQLIAGPIVQYKTIAEQLNNRVENIDDFSSGVSKFMVGLGKKVLLANNIGLLWDTVSKSTLSEVGVVTAWLGIVAFAFQIYFDFSGYSDMAIGLGRMFGFKFLENFNYPYMSKSITEFWRRWHISLGSWFRDYLYIPLGGNRCSIGKQIRNIAIVWLATGVWHGASWNFLLWGVYFGVLLVIEKMFIGKRLEQLPVIIRHIYTLVLVLISWVIFAFEDMSLIGEYVSTMVGLNGNPLVDEYTMYYLSSYGVILTILIFACTSIPNKLWNNGMSRIKSELVREVICSVGYVMVFVVSVAYLVDSTYNPFLYFRF